MACCTFGKFEIQTSTPNRYQNQTNDTLKLLARNCNHQQGFVKQTHHCGFNLKIFLNTFINIAVLGKLYQCSSYYAKLEQHWIKFLCVHSSPIIQRLVHQKTMLSISVCFHKNSLIVACCTFRRFEIRTFKPNRFKNQTNGTLKPLGHNCNHQQGFVTLKIVALHRCCFNLKFLK